MTDVFIREAKLLALRRLRGVDPPPERPHRELEAAFRSGDGPAVPPPSDAPPFTWSRPQVTLLWSQLEQAVAEHHRRRPAESQFCAGGGLSPSASNNISTSVPYLVYRQTVCQELARELGYGGDGGHGGDDSDPSKTMTVEERAKVLSIYRQHLCAGPANYFDLWRSENAEALLLNAQNSSGGKSKQQQKLRDPQLVDLMSQVGAIGFFADLRTLLDGIRVENTTNLVQERLSASRPPSVARSPSTSSSPPQQHEASKALTGPQRAVTVKVNPALRSLFYRIKQRYGIVATPSAAAEQRSGSSTGGSESAAADEGSSPKLPMPRIKLLLSAPPPTVSGVGAEDDISNGNAVLTVADLESFVKELLPNIRGARDAPPWLQPYYIAHAVARIAFDADPNRRGRLTTNGVLHSPALTDLLQLHESHASDAALVFPRDFPVNIAIEHAKLAPLHSSSSSSSWRHHDPRQEEAEDEERQEQTMMLEAAIAQACESADPGELTLVEAIVVKCPAPQLVAQQQEQEGGNADASTESSVIVDLHLPRGDGDDDNDAASALVLRLAVPRSSVFFPTSREALSRFREVMELLVSADETGDRAGAAEVDFHMRLHRESGARSTSPEKSAGAAANGGGEVDDVDSDTVILSGTRRIAENWFSLPRMLSLYYDFIVLDADRDGVLREAELRNYRNRALIPFAISRVFEVFASAAGTDGAGGATITYTSYLDFVIATEYPHLAASQRYLWRLLDLEGGGNVLTVRGSLNFFAIEICKVLASKGVANIAPESLMAELLDMLRVRVDDGERRVSLERDVLRSKMGGVVLPLFMDWHSFVKYESREQQRQMEQVLEDEEDGEQEEANENDHEQQEQHEVEDEEDESGEREEVEVDGSVEGAT